MALVQANLECVNTTGYFSMWHYRSTTDAIATIRASGYFNAAAGNMNTGDVMFIGPDSAGVGGISMVTNTAGVITLGAGSPMMVEAEAKDAAKAGEKAAGQTGPTGPAGTTGTTGGHEAQKAAAHK